MITFYSRKYEVLAQASFDGNEGLIAYDDEFHDDLKTGIATYTFSIDKTDDTIANIELGCYIRVLTFDGRKLWFEVLDMEETNERIDFTAVDAGLDLIGESVWPYEADQGYLITHYLKMFLLDSGWTIGTFSMKTLRSLKLKFEGFESASKRIRQVAKHFGMELEYEIDEKDGKP